jgi:thiamine biosynthesis lipoprotein
MGTVFSFRVTAPGVDPARVEPILRWLHDMDAMFSPYRPESEVSRINAGTLTVKNASAEVRAVVAACEYWTAETDGYFSAHAAGQRLDPSGYVKGWAVQRAAEMLAAGGSVNHYVNGGGDVSCAGRPEPGRGWRIGISDPHRRSALVDVVEAAGPVAVATSGLAERGAHIVDPHSGAPATGLAAVSVVAGDLIVADVAATAAAAMGIDRAVTWLRSRPELAALLIAPDATITRVGEWPITRFGSA